MTNYTEYALTGTDPETGHPFVTEETFDSLADAQALQRAIEPEYGATEIVTRTVTAWEKHHD